MYRAIMVPLDGSPLSERALPTATRLALTTGARLVIVRAAWEPSLPDGYPSAMIQEVREAEEYLSGIAARLGERGITVETVVPHAPATEGVLGEAEARQSEVDLIVMSTHGRSGIGRWVYGSVAEAVLVRSPVPVLLIRASGSSASLALQGGHPRLLVPLDGSEFAEEAIPHAAALARSLGGSIILLQALMPPIPPSTELPIFVPIIDPAEMRQQMEEAEAYLTKVAKQLSLEGVRASVVVRPGAADDAIIDEARELGASLIVMATHGRTGLQRLLFGNVAAAVLHRGDRPLMLVRPAGVIANKERVDTAKSY